MSDVAAVSDILRAEEQQEKLTAHGERLAHSQIEPQIVRGTQIVHAGQVKNAAILRAREYFVERRIGLTR